MHTPLLLNHFVTVLGGSCSTELGHILINYVTCTCSIAYGSLIIVVYNNNNNFGDESFQAIDCTGTDNFPSYPPDSHHSSDVV